MWNPSKEWGMKTFDKVLDKANEASVELNKADQRLTSGSVNELNKRDVNEANRINHNLNEAVEKRQQLLGEAVKYGRPFGASTISESESRGEERRDDRREYDKEKRERDIDDRDAKRDDKREERKEERERREDDRDARRDDKREERGENKSDSRKEEDKDIDEMREKHHKMANEDVKLIKDKFEEERKKD